MAHDVYAVRQNFAKSGIHLGWAEAFASLNNDYEELDPDPKSILDYVSESTDMLRYYGAIGGSEKPPPIKAISGFEVGDDRKDESQSPTGLAISLVVQESVFKMITSDQDTFISSERSNFCEVTTIAPRTRLGNFSYARKNDTTRHLEYVDVMPLRIIIDVSKSNQGEHSSSIPGKASMAGPKMSQSRPDMREMLSLGNLLQDGLLITHRSKEPKYLPSIMGGSGSPALFGDARNLYLYMQTYRGGGHSRIYGSSVREIMDLFIRMEGEGTYAPPQLTDRLRMKEAYLYGTYKEKVFIPKKAYEDTFKGIGLPPPLYEAGKTTSDIALGESRLVNAKLLITRSQALVEVEKTRRNDQVLFGRISMPGARSVEKFQLLEARRGFDGALSANTALARMLERRANDSDMEKMMKSSFFNYSSAGEREFTLRHAEWITAGAKSNVYSIRDLRRPEDMFVRTEVSTEENMKVSGIERLWVKNGKSVITETTTKIGLWQVNQSHYEHAESTLDALISARDSIEGTTLSRASVLQVMYQHREDIDDDGVILDKAIKDTQFTAVGVGVLVLISTDYELAKSISRKTGKYLIRISPNTLVPHVGNKVSETISALDGNPALFAKYVVFDQSLRWRITQILNVYVDTGSLQATLSRYDEGVLPGRRSKTMIFESRIIEVGTDNSGHRFEKTGLRPVKAKEQRLIVGGRPSKDKYGHWTYSHHRPDSRLQMRVNKFDSYMDNQTEARSESDSGFSLFSQYSEELEMRSETEVDFSPFLSPDFLD
jgi:hypothetical protein